MNAICEFQQHHKRRNVDNIEIYKNTLFHFVKGEIKGGKGPNRASVTAEERRWRTRECSCLMIGGGESGRTVRWRGYSGKSLPKQTGGFSGPSVNQVRLFEGLKKEFRLTRIYWRPVYDSVAGVNELNKCTMRLRLKYEEEAHTPANWFTFTTKRLARDNLHPRAPRD